MNAEIVNPTAYQIYLDYCSRNANAGHTAFFTGLQELFQVSDRVTLDIWYAPQRSWFVPEMIEELIRLDHAGEPLPNLTSGEFKWDEVNKKFIEGHWRGRRLDEP